MRLYVRQKMMWNYYYLQIVLHAAVDELVGRKQNNYRKGKKRRDPKVTKHIVSSDGLVFSATCCLCTHTGHTVASLQCLLQSNNIHMRSIFCVCGIPAQYFPYINKPTLVNFANTLISHKAPDCTMCYQVGGIRGTLWIFELLLPVVVSIPNMTTSGITLGFFYGNNSFFFFLFNTVAV